MKFKGFELIKVCEYHVWKNGLHLFNGSLSDCIEFLNKNPTGIRKKRRRNNGLED